MYPDSIGKHRSPWKGFYQKNQFSILSWGSIFLGIFTVYHAVSDGDFSFLMTLSSLFVLFAFALLLIKALMMKSISNISLKTLECYALIFIGRLSSILFYEGYLPYDKSGDWFYQLSEILALIMVITLIVYIVGIYPQTYSATKDTFKLNLIPGLTLAPEVRVLQLVIPAFIIAIIFHPSLNNNILTDTAWTFALYLEAVAMIPQVMLYQEIQDARMGLEPFEANFMFSIAVARGLQFAFWISSYHELNDKYGTNITKQYPGHMVLFSQIANLVILGNFILKYISNARKGSVLVI